MRQGRPGAAAARNYKYTGGAAVGTTVYFAPYHEDATLQLSELTLYSISVHTYACAHVVMYSITVVMY